MAKDKNAHTWETEAERVLWVQGQPGLHGETISEQQNLYIIKMTRLSLKFPEIPLFPELFPR